MVRNLLFTTSIYWHVAGFFKAKAKKGYFRVKHPLLRLLLALTVQWRKKSYFPEVTVMACRDIFDGPLLGDILQAV